MGISLTLFKSIFDNKTNKRIDAKDFDAFESVLYDLSEKPFKNKKDAINYLREDYLESIYPFLEINCHGKRERYSFKDHLNQFKIIKVNDSIPISEQV